MRPTKTFSASANTFSFLYRLIDLSIVFGSLQMAAVIYGTPLNREYMIAALLVSVAFLYISESLDLYRSWRVGHFSEEILLSWVCIVISFLTALVIAFLLKESSGFSRVTIVLWFSFTTGLSLIWRMILRQQLRSRRKAGYNIKKVAIIGATESCDYLLKEIQKREELGFELIGIYEDRESSRNFGDLKNYVVGNIDQGISQAHDGNIDTLFISLSLRAEERIANLLLQLGDTTVDVHYIPDFLVSNLMHARIAHVGDVDTLSIFESPYFGANKWLKRIEDLVLGCLILAIIFTPLIVIAIGIKLTSTGPVLFKQRRYGLRGEEINVWKFRTMSTVNNKSNVIQATKNDSRVTPFGRFLRRTSCDELPQFFNVLKGDMSIVGPRPHAVAHNEIYRSQVQYYMLRHKVKPGITGWAQINGWRGETDTLEKMAKRIEYDLQYIKHWSLWWDVKIIFRTLHVVYVGNNAY